MEISLQNKILVNIGLSSSIGVATNKMIAKIASDYKKPNGLTIVEPGKENVEIKVITKHGGLEGVSIDLYYEGQKYAEYTTDENGKAYMDVPSINSDNYFSLIVEKEGYSTYYLEEEFVISLFERGGRVSYC